MNKSLRKRKKEILRKQQILLLQYSRKIPDNERKGMIMHVEGSSGAGKTTVIRDIIEPYFRENLLSYMQKKISTEVKIVVVQDSEYGERREELEGYTKKHRVELMEYLMLLDPRERERVQEVIDDFQRLRSLGMRAVINFETHVLRKGGVIIKDRDISSELAAAFARGYDPERVLKFSMETYIVPDSLFFVYASPDEIDRRLREREETQLKHSGRFSADKQWRRNRENGYRNAIQYIYSQRRIEVCTDQKDGETKQESIERIRKEMEKSLEKIVRRYKNRLGSSS